MGVGLIGLRGLVVTAMAAACVSAAAQPWVAGDRPGDAPLPLPDFAPQLPEPDQTLPFPSALPAGPSASGEEGEYRLSGVRISGSTLLSEAQIAAITRPFLARNLSESDLLDLRDRLSLEYVRRGYVSSGAILAGPPGPDGVLDILIVEARTLEVTIQTDGRFRPDYLQRRLQRNLSRPVNVFALEEQLQLFRQDERVESLDAQLTPGRTPGQTALALALHESPRMQLSAEVNNYQSPAVGEFQAIAGFAHNNLSGVGDRIFLEYRRAEGLDAVEVSYRTPVNAHDTSLKMVAYLTDSKLVEEPFDMLGIKGDSASYAMILSHPLRRDAFGSSSISFSAEYRTTDSKLLGDGFSFDPGAEDGEANIAVVRSTYELARRGARQVFAWRTSLSVGLDALDATSHSVERNDGQFLSLLNQVHWARRVGERGMQVIGRFDSQLANDGLLSLEKYAVGGYASVRGYRETALVRDNGVLASIELRRPVLYGGGPRPKLELSVFVDAARSWNDGMSDDAKNIYSVGGGVRWQFAERAGLEFSWAEALNDLDFLNDSDLQDKGVQLRIWARG